MTLDVLLDLLRGHRAALQSGAWSQPHSPSSGPAFFLDEAETNAAILELMRLKAELTAARAMRADQQLESLGSTTTPTGLRTSRPS